MKKRSRVVNSHTGFGIRKTRHAMARMSQRGLGDADIDLLRHYGSEVPDGYLFSDKDFRDLVTRARRLRGTLAVVAGSQLITAYHANGRTITHLLRSARKKSL